MNFKDGFAVANALAAWGLAVFAAIKGEWGLVAGLVAETLTFSAGWLHFEVKDRQAIRSAVLSKDTNADLKDYPDLLT